MASQFRLRLAFLSGFAAGILVCAPATVPLRAAGFQGPARVHSHEFRREIDGMEDAWRAAILKGDSMALGNLLAEDYTGITARGAIQTKQQAIESLRTGALQLTTLQISDRKVRVYGATAVVTSLAELTGSKKDLEVSGRYRYTRVYVRNPQGQWKIVSFEASRIQEPGERK